MQHIHSGETGLSNWDQLNAEITSCRRCPRLVQWREEVALKKRRAFQDCEYWGKPVPGFGDPQARILVVGLAPGAHGSNRTGRMFTGDASGEFLYAALYRARFANQPVSQQRSDSLALKDLFITAVGRCAPPGNKPNSEELANCRSFLLREIALLEHIEGIVALGKIAFDEVLDIFREELAGKPKPVFSHAAFYPPGSGLPWLLASYHPSRQNTQTGRLTQAMFDDIWFVTRAQLCHEA